MEFVKGHYGKKTDIFLAGAAHGRTAQREEDAALADQGARVESKAGRDGRADALFALANAIREDPAAAIRATGNTEEET